MPQELEVKVSRLEGSPAAESGKLVRVFEHTPEEELLQGRGRLFAVLELTLDSTLDTSLAEKLVLDTLTEEYYTSSEETPIQALERAVYAARGKLRDFSEKSALDFAVVTLWGKVAYLARIGRPALYLRRGPEVRELLSGEGLISVGSQLLEGEDVIVLGSPGFAKNFTPQNLPETEFLVREFEKEGGVLGLSALLLRLKGPVSPSPSPRTGGLGALLAPQARGGLRLASRLGERAANLLSQRISRGRELAAERKMP